MKTINYLFTGILLLGAIDANAQSAKKSINHKQ